MKVYCISSMSTTNRALLCTPNTFRKRASGKIVFLELLVDFPKIKQRYANYNTDIFGQGVVPTTARAPLKARRMNSFYNSGIHPQPAYTFHAKRALSSGTSPKCGGVNLALRGGKP